MTSAAPSGSSFVDARATPAAPPEPVDRVRRLLALHGVDALIVVAAIESAVGTALRTDPEAPDGALLGLEMVVIAGLVLVLLARGRFPSRHPRRCGSASPRPASSTVG